MGKYHIFQEITEFAPKNTEIYTDSEMCWLEALLLAFFGYKLCNSPYTNYPCLRPFGFTVIHSDPIIIHVTFDSPGNKLLIQSVAVYSPHPLPSESSVPSDICAGSPETPYKCQDVVGNDSKEKKRRREYYVHIWAKNE